MKDAFPTAFESGHIASLRCKSSIPAGILFQIRPTSLRSVRCRRVHPASPARSGADPISADLVNADLIGEDLIDADLIGADQIGANQIGADQINGCLIIACLISTAARRPRAAI